MPFQEEKFSRAWSFLYSDYREGCYFWESITLLRKLLVVVVVVISSMGIRVQMLVRGCMIAAGTNSCAWCRVVCMGLGIRSQVLVCVVMG